MANDLKILITSSLNMDSSKTEINRKIKELEGQVEKLKLNIVVDDKVAKTLNDFSKAMENHKKIAEDLNRVIKEEKVITKEADGTIREKIKQHLKSGEIIEKEIEKINKKNKAMKDEEAEIGRLISDYQKLGQIQKEINKQDGKGNSKGTVEKYRDNFTDTVYKSNKDGNVTSVTTTQNYDQQRKAVEQLQTKLNELRQTGEVSEKTLTRLGNAINSAHSVAEIEKIRGRLNTLDSAVQSREKTKELEKQLELYRRQAEIQVNALRNNPNKIISSTQDTQLTNYLNSVNALNARTPDLQNRMRQLALDFREVSTQTLTAGRNTMTWGQALQTAMQKFPIWMVASTAFFQTFNFFKDGIAYVNELNKALTEIAIVTGKSQAEVEQLGLEYQKLAYTMGVLTTDIASATKEFYRQGLSQEEVMSRAKVATEYAKISALDFKTSAEVLTATVNSMGISIERASDVFSYLGDATATSSSEIGQAFQRVGGSASAINLEFEKVASWIAVLSARTREGAGTIGNSIKSMIARVQNLKENGFDEEDGTKINDVAKALNSVGVALTDNQGQFRNFGTVMDELGARWKDLDTRQKSYVATTVAGTYQQAKFFNLMEGYSDTIPLYQKSLEAAGTTQQKFNQYQQSTEATLNRLKDTWTSVWQASFQSDTIRSVINLLDLLAKGFKGTIDTIGFLPTAIGLATTAFLAFNSTTRNSIVSTGMLSASLVRAGDSMLITSGASRGLQVALYNTTLAARATGSAFTFMGNAMKTGLTFLTRAALPIAGFMALGFAIQKVTEAIQKQREEARKLKEEQDDIVKKYSSHSDQIDQLASEYENLSNKVKNGQLDKNSEVYVNNMNELGKLMPSLVQSTNEHGDSILRSVDAVKQELDYAKQLKENYAQMAVANFEKDLDKQAGKVEEILDKIKGFESDKKVKIAGKVEIMPTEGEKLFADRQIIAQERELQLLLSNSGKYMNEKAKAIMDVEGITSKLSDSNKKLVESFINEAVASKKSVKDGEDFKQFLSDTTNKAVDFAAKLAKIPEALVGVFSTKQVNKLSKDQIQALKAISDNLENGGSGWEYYKQSLLNVGFSSKQADSIIKELTKSTKENADQAVNDTIRQQELAKAIEDATKQYDESLSKIEDLSKALYELDSKQGLTADTISLIASKYPELLAYINDEKALRENLASTIDAEKNIAIDAMVTKLSTNEKFFSEAKKLNSNYFNQLAKFYGIDLENTTTLAQLKFQVESKLMEKLGDAWATYYDAQAMAFTADGKAMLEHMGYQEAINSPQLKAIADYEASMKSISSTMRNFTVESGYSAGITAAQTKALEDVTKANDKANKSTENSIYVSDKYKQALEEINAELEKYQAILKQFPDYSKEYRDALSKEIDLLKEKKKLIQDQAKSLDQQIKSGKVQQYGIITTGSGTKSTSTSSNSYASGGSNEAQIWNFFKSKGFSDSIVAGIMGNLQLESGLNTNALNKSSGAFGLAQWLGGRKTGLNNFARQRGTSASDLDTQLAWLWQELNGSEKRTLNWILNNQNASASTAAAQWDKLFERSEGTSVAGRQRYANNFYNKYAGSGGSYVTSSSDNASKDAAEAAQNIDQAKSDLLGLYQDISDADAQIKEIEFAILNSYIAEYDHAISQQNSRIEMDKKRMELYSEYFVYQKAMISDQALAYQQMLDTIDKERGYINQQILSGKLNATQISELRDKLAELNNEYLDYQINLKNTNTELVELLKAQKDKINEESDAFIEAYKAFYEKKRDIDQKAYDDQMALIDKQESERDYNKDLKERQKGIEELKQQIAALSMDDSQKGKLADLQQQLAEKQDDLGEFTHDKEIDDRKNNLEEQKKLNDEYYDNLLNDERNFAKMKEDILAGNIQKYQDMMKGWKDYVLANLDEIGQSIGNNIIDQMNKATKGLEDAKGQVSDLNTIYKGDKENISGKDTKKADQVTILSDVPLLKKTENGYELSGTILKKGQVYKAYGINEKDGVYNIGGGYVSADPTVSKYKRFNTGGYTGDGEGLAYLDKKEIILNKMDTSNFLKAIDITRSISNMLHKFKLPTFNQNPVNANGGNTFNINLKIDRLLGTKNDAELVLNEIVKGVNLLGMKM
jgi:TP901 family phage tail tape measure protein